MGVHRSLIHLATLEWGTHWNDALPSQVFPTTCSSSTPEDCGPSLRDCGWLGVPRDGLPEQVGPDRRCPWRGQVGASASVLWFACVLIISPTKTGLGF